MSKSFLAAVIVLFSIINGFTQPNLYSSETISEDLTKNANAVLRIDETKLEISSVTSLNHSYRRIITILNKNGNRHLGTAVAYDDNINIRKLSATVYDKFGNEIKKFKKSDFQDVAAVSSISLYEDSRVKYLKYTPINYPYTVEFYYEKSTNNTGYLPFWRPLEGYFVSTENSSFEIIYDESVGVNKKEKNLGTYSILDKSESGKLLYEAKSIAAIKPESYSPKFRQFGPQLLVSAVNFHYEGYTGTMKDWESLGKWFHNNLLKGRSSVSENTRTEVLNLVKGIENPIDRAKIIYDYVQKNTRYISVQVGIGGIQPISAQEVDNVKYGDCKGLTNYTKALLDLVGVESYYTEVYASRDMQYNVEQEFATLFGQGNHVILNIPIEGEESKWLECTSQIIPFGFLGDFTDNRDVFVITPYGGKVVRTPKYDASMNTQKINGVCNLSDTGEIEVNYKVVSHGIQYDDKFALAELSEEDLDEYYKGERWEYLNNLTFNKIDLSNNRNDIEFVENLNFSASNYCSLAGERMLFKINVLNRLDDVPNRYRNRKLPLEILRGFQDIDEVEFNLPNSYKIESIPQTKIIETKFGTYKAEVVLTDENTLIYKRELVVFDSTYPKEDYSEFRTFYKNVSKFDNSKIALIKK